jgi:hypothetical protein
MPSLANQVDNDPVILPFLQALDGNMSQLRVAKSTTEADREDGSAALSLIDWTSPEFSNALASSELSQLPSLTPTFFAPFTRQIPAANSGSAGRYRPLRMPVSERRPIAS